MTSLIFDAPHSSVKYTSLVLENKIKNNILVAAVCYQTTATVSYNPLGIYKTAAHNRRLRKVKVQVLDFFPRNRVKYLGQIPLELLNTSTLLDLLELRQLSLHFLSLKTKCIHPQYPLAFTVMKQLQRWNDPIVFVTV